MERTQQLGQLSSLDDAWSWLAAINLDADARRGLNRMKAKIERQRIRHGEVSNIRHGVGFYEGHSANDGDDVGECPSMHYAWLHLTFGTDRHLEVNIKLDGPCPLN